MASSPAPLPELTRWQIIIGIVLGLAIPGGTFAAAWGNTTTRLAAVEARMEQTVTRAELAPLIENVREVRDELKGLRADLLSIVKERR